MSAYLRVTTSNGVIGQPLSPTSRLDAIVAGVAACWPDSKVPADALWEVTDDALSSRDATRDGSRTPAADH